MTNTIAKNLIAKKRSIKKRARFQLGTAPFSFSVFSLAQLNYDMRRSDQGVICRPAAYATPPATARMAANVLTVTFVVRMAKVTVV